MNIKRFLLTNLIILTGYVFGQFSDPVTVGASAIESARAGEVVDVEVTFEIDRGWHIYGMEKIDDGPIPTSIEITGDIIDQVGKSMEPKPTIAYDEGLFHITQVLLLLQYLYY